ncbi:MAG TPA: glycosyltransferase 87 family protein [Verrucomicrobiae bacterium]|nr:glycosyltransferase 87 family protein [Verrucomicrobiae bacterium]
MSSERRADIAFGIGLGIGILFIVITGPLDRRLELVHENDFSGFWAGARALVIGADPYDGAHWRDTVGALGTQEPNTAVYGYVPWVAVALVPLALLPLETAAWIWMIAGIALAAIALRALLRAAVPGQQLLHGAFGLALLVSQPGFHAVVLGQWSFVLLAALCGSVLALRSGRDATAGALAASFLAKPQLFVWTSLGLLVNARDRRRLVTSGVLVAGAIVAVSWMVLPGWWAAWTSDVAPSVWGAPPRSPSRCAICCRHPSDSRLRSR